MLKAFVYFVTVEEVEPAQFFPGFLHLHYHYLFSKIVYTCDRTRMTGRAFC